MNLSSFEWLVVAAVGSILFTIVGYFLKRTMATTDTNCADISTLKHTAVTKSEVQHHEKDINHIKQTYVTKDEMKEMRSEWRAEIEKITATVMEIRDTNLPKEDFYRSHMETNRKLEKLQQLIIDNLGGSS